MAKKSEDLKRFRHDISTLKRKGLLTGIDARSATPTKRLRNLLGKYDDVLSGKATAVKLPAKTIKEYKALGKPYEVTHPKGLPQRVIIPHEAGQRVTVSSGKVSINNQKGITRTILPVRFENLPKFFNQIKKTAKPLGPNESYAFRFFGNRSHKTFSSAAKLIASLEQYESVFDSIEENDAEAQSEIYQNLEIVKIDRPEEWKNRPAPTHKPWRGGTAYEKRKRKLEEAPAWKRELVRQANADRQQSFRASMTPAELEAYRAAGRKRAKKSKRAIKKTKKKTAKKKK